jgi:predicted nucleic acid-binding protein
VRKVDMQSYVFLDGFADAGETEAMVLYKQIAADKLLIDDHRGRNVAKLNHISTNWVIRRVFGCEAKRAYRCCAPLLLKLEKSELYLSKQLITTVLECRGS